MVTVKQLAAIGAKLIDLHGQHQHQSLLAASAQRQALDDFAQIDLTPLAQARAALAEKRAELDSLGGDLRARAQEIDLLSYQINEIAELNIEDPNELETIAAAEDELADAVSHIEAGQVARQHLADDPADSATTAIDQLNATIAALADRTPYAEITQRLRAAHAEVADIADDLRHRLDQIEDNPEALADTRKRRQSLLDLTRKYGDTLTEVLAFADQAKDRLDTLERHEELAARLEADIATAEKKVAAEAKKIAKARRQAAPELAAAVTKNLPPLAMENAELSIDVAGEDPADQVTMNVATNSGQTPGPLAKVASGGELARIMLALRLVLTAGPPTLVFDEVDAGIGGEAAVAVGRSLAQLAGDHQVLVVTHLPQVGAFAHHQVAIKKTDDGTTVASDVIGLDDSARIDELTRMLAGLPESDSGRTHAAELLKLAAQQQR